MKPGLAWTRRSARDRTSALDGRVPSVLSGQGVEQLLVFKFPACACTRCVCSPKRLKFFFGPISGVVPVGLSIRQLDLQTLECLPMASASRNTRACADHNVSY